MATGAQIVTSVTIINSLLGYNGVSLTNYVTSALTTIAAGSKLEIGGSFFHWATAETPVASSWTAIATASTAYLKCTPSGSAGTQISTARWSSVTPVWSESKQGWYASAASIARVVASAYKTSATKQDKKRLLVNKQVDSLKLYGNSTVHADGAIDSDTTISADGKLSGSALSVTSTASAGGIITGGGGIIAGTGNSALLKKVVDIGDWNMDSTASVSVAHGLTLAKIRAYDVFIRNDSGELWRTTQYDATTFISAYAKADATNIVITRYSPSFFDSTDFNATSYNRGWIIIEYVP